MMSRQVRSGLVVVGSAVLVLALFGLLARSVGRPYPGFFVSPDHRVYPVDAAVRESGMRFGDRIVAVDGLSPVALEGQLASGAPVVRVELERAGTPVAVDVRPRPLGWSTLLGTFGGYYVVSALMLAVGVLVLRQNPSATPNRRFLVYMSLWAVANVAIPDATMGPDKYTAALLGLCAPLLSVHGWVFFLSFPVNPRRAARLAR